MFEMNQRLFQFRWNWIDLDGTVWQSWIGAENGKVEQIRLLCVVVSPLVQITTTNCWAAAKWILIEINLHLSKSALSTIIVQRKLVAAIVHFLINSAEFLTKTIKLKN